MACPRLSRPLLWRYLRVGNATKALILSLMASSRCLICSRVSPSRAALAASMLRNPVPMETVLESYTCTLTLSATESAATMADWQVPLPFAVTWMEIMSLASEASWLYTSTKSPGEGLEVLGITLPSNSRYNSSGERLTFSLYDSSPIWMGMGTTVMSYCFSSSFGRPEELSVTTFTLVICLPP